MMIAAVINPLIAWSVNIYVECRLLMTFLWMFPSLCSTRDSEVVFLHFTCCKFSLKFRHLSFIIVFFAFVHVHMHSCKLVKTTCNTNAAKCCYTNRIVLAWNSLSDTVVTASSVNAFRQQLNTVNLKKFLIVG